MISSVSVAPRARSRAKLVISQAKGGVASSAANAARGSRFAKSGALGPPLRGTAPPGWRTQIDERAAAVAERCADTSRTT